MECSVEGRGGGQDRGDIKTLIVSFEGERLRAKKQCFLISVVGEKSKAWGGGDDCRVARAAHEISGAVAEVEEGEGTQSGTWCDVS